MYRCVWAPYYSMAIEGGVFWGLSSLPIGSVLRQIVPIPVRLRIVGRLGY